MKDIIIYTDGACSGNPGVGGWAAILKYKDKTKEICGGEQDTTNNRMELFAVIMALEALKEPCRVKLYSDSQYVVDAFLQGWITNWQLNGWKTAGKKEVKNVDLWERLLKQTALHQVEFIKVKGHADNEYNNRCDQLATGEAKKLLIKD